MSLIFASILLLSSSIQSATIAELVQQRASTLGRAASAIASHPEWSGNGPISLFVPTDAALANSNLPSNALGSVQVDQSIEYLTDPTYQILKDTKSSNIMVYGKLESGP